MEGRSKEKSLIEKKIIKVRKVVRKVRTVFGERVGRRKTRTLCERPVDVLWMALWKLVRVQSGSPKAESSEFIKSVQRCVPATFAHTAREKSNQIQLLTFRTCVGHVVHQWHGESQAGKRRKWPKSELMNKSQRIGRIRGRYQASSKQAKLASLIKNINWKQIYRL